MRFVHLGCLCGLIGASAAHLSAQQYLFGRAQFPTGAGPVGLVTYYSGLGPNILPNIATANANGTVSFLAGKADGTFAPHADYPVGHGPTSIAMFFRQHDGQPVFAVTNGDDNTVSMLFAGTTQRTDYPTGVEPSSVTVAVLQQGHFSLIVANKNCPTNTDGRCDGHTGSVSIYTINSDGTLQPPVEYPAGIAPVQVAVGELNGDSYSDIAVANEVASPKSVSMLFGNGDGTFRPPVAFGDTGGARSIAIAQAEEVAYTGVGTSGSAAGVYLMFGNGKGDFSTPREYNIQGGAAPAILAANLGNPGVDIAAGTYESLAVLLGNPSNGLLAAPSYYGGGPGEVESIVSADFNGDGRPDLAFVAQGVDAVTVLIGDGAGHFSPQADYTTVQDPIQIIAADFNDDLKLDLASVNEVNGGPGTASVFLNSDNGLFSPPVNYAAGKESVSLVSGDFNHDGREDLAIANDDIPNPGNFSVLLGNGDGTFKPHADYPTGYGPRWISTGDFNKDGKPDLVIADAGDAINIGSTVSVHLGKGDGTFNGPVSYPVGKLPVSTFVGDFNGDGNPDIAVANRLDKTVSILLGNGNGTFRSHIDYPAGSALLDSIVGGDFNDDGRLDLVVSGDDGVVRLLVGRGDGTFGAPVTIANPGVGYAQQLATGDLNGDGKLDLILAEYVSPECIVLLGNGNGTFQPPLYYQGSLYGTGNFFLSQSVDSAIAADLNGDGHPDMAVANAATTGIVSVYLNTPVAALYPPAKFVDVFPTERAGTTTSPQTVQLSNPSAVPLKISAITATQPFIATSNCPTALGPGANCTVSIVFSPPSAGSFQGTVTIQDNAIGGPQIIPVDGNAYASPVAEINAPVIPGSATPGGPAFTLTVNGEGFAPQAVVLWNGSPRATHVVSVTQLTAAISAADIAHAGTAWISVMNPVTEPSNSVPFEIATPITTISPLRRDAVTGASPRSVAVGDFNHDGKQDMAVANFSAGTVSILLGNGDGTFQAHQDYAVGTEPIFVVAADFNSDGKLDLAVANFGSNNVSILLGKGDGTFQPSQNYRTGSGPTSIAVGDFDQFGYLDLAVSNYSSNTVSILQGSAEGAFSDPTDYAVGTEPLSVAVADVNGDDFLDIVVANYGSNNVSLLLGSENHVFRTETPLPTGVSPRGVLLEDVNNDGKPDVITVNYTPNTVSILLNNGNATFQPHVDYATGLHPFALVAGDFNGDGRVDLAVADTYCSTSCPSYGYASVLLGNGNGTFQPQKAYVVGSQPVAIATGDFNGDGRPDIVTANFHGNSVSVLLQ